MLDVSGLFINFVVLVVDSVECFHAVQYGHIDIQEQERHGLERLRVGSRGSDVDLVEDAVEVLGDILTVGEHNELLRDAHFSKVHSNLLLCDELVIC